MLLDPAGGCISIFQPLWELVLRRKLVPHRHHMSAAVVHQGAAQCIKQIQVSCREEYRELLLLGARLGEDMGCHSSYLLQVSICSHNALHASVGDALPLHILCCNFYCTHGYSICMQCATELFILCCRLRAICVCMSDKLSMLAVHDAIHFT